jgi:hypothetical protein
MPLVRYSATVVDAIQAATRSAMIVKGGLDSIRTNRSELAACFHTVEDYAFQQTFGDFVVGESIPLATEEQEVALYSAIEDLCLEVGDICGFNAPVKGDVVGKVNWREFIRTYLPMVLEILLKMPV